MTARGRTRAAAGERNGSWGTAALELSGAAAAGNTAETFVSYPMADEVIAECERRIVSMEGLAKPHLLLTGDPLNGKHSIVRWAARRHRPFRVRSSDLPIVPLAVLEWPLASAAGALRDALAHAVGVLEAADWVDLAQAYREMSVRLVVVRNAHELLERNRDEQDALWAELLEFAQSAQVRLLFVGTSAIRAAFDRQPQWLQPVQMFHLPLWTPTALVPFLRQWQVAQDRALPDLAPHAPLLVEAAGGRLGLIVRALRDAFSREGGLDDAHAFARRVWMAVRGEADGIG